MLIFSCWYFSKEVNNFVYYLEVCITCFEPCFCTVTCGLSGELIRILLFTTLHFRVHLRWCLRRNYFSEIAETLVPQEF